GAAAHAHGPSAVSHGCGTARRDDDEWVPVEHDVAAGACDVRAAQPETGDRRGRDPVRCPEYPDGPREPAAQQFGEDDERVDRRDHDVGGEPGTVAHLDPRGPYTADVDGGDRRPVPDVDAPL